jgi:hypothetical protein
MRVVGASGVACQQFEQRVRARSPADNFFYQRLLEAVCGKEALIAAGGGVIFPKRYKPPIDLISADPKINV